MTRRWLVLALVAGGTRATAAQEQFPATGQVTFTVAAAPEVCFTCWHGVANGWTRAKDCDRREAVVWLELQDGRVRRLEVAGAGQPVRHGRGGQALGRLPAAAVGRWALARAERDDPAAEHLIALAVVTDSTESWPTLARMARNDRLRLATRRTATFWLGQHAGEKVAPTLEALATDRTEDDEVREHAVFALSQRPRDDGVPALLRLARNADDPRLRRKALFWLGQSGDARAVAMFEEILAK